MAEPKAIVQWFAEKEQHKCGYCKSPNGSVHFGMWAQTLSVEYYQTLIDRGWRRSGQYCYKPVMDETCCPLYTIRCDALNFHPSKSQKKVIKKLNKFLKCGSAKNKDQSQAGPQTPEVITEEGESIMKNVRDYPDKKIFDLSKIQKDQEVVDSDISSNIDSKLNDKNRDVDEILSNTNIAGLSDAKIIQSTSQQPMTFKKGMGADPTKPPCKKAKTLRIEKKMKKMEKLGETMDVASVITKQKEKTLEELINEVSANDKLKLTTKLLEPTNLSGEWKKYQVLEFELYRKYQNIIHNDPPHKNKMDTFVRFLVNTPLKRQEVTGSSSNCAYGSYHQQYWLDDKLIAVGVIDILPKCVSAVYFFYDPDYRELTLGTYGALKEIQLAKELYPCLNTQFYYMGYYIHNCKKMRYKGNMNPSFLLCPETYEWFPIQECFLKLENKKYCRFNEDTDVIDEDECSSGDINKIKILISNQLITFQYYNRRFLRAETFMTMGKLIGKICTKSMVFLEDN